jgi:formylglycine-generating enzyme required for sulfatase activity
MRLNKCETQLPLRRRGAESRKAMLQLQVVSRTLLVALALIVLVGWPLNHNGPLATDGQGGSKGQSPIHTPTTPRPPTPPKTPTPCFQPTLPATSVLPPAPWGAPATFTFDYVEVNKQGQVTRHEDQRKAQYFTEDLGGGVRLEMVVIKGGTFTLGSPTQEKDRKPSESPQLKVDIPAFCLGRFEVTQAQWCAVARMPKVGRVLDPAKSAFRGANRPVELISWLDAEEFCKRLSDWTKREYRLPSEAEWEYACRAGTETPFAFGETLIQELANFGNVPELVGPLKEYPKQTTPVGFFNVANRFGLSDMHGNVWEWCQDVYYESYVEAQRNGSARDDQSNDKYNRNRVLRGGAWANSGPNCRSAIRNWESPYQEAAMYGFRIATTALPPLATRSRRTQPGKP